jgi:hypothetical protein
MDEGLAFLAIDPFLFRPDYEIDVDDAALAEIGVSSPSDVLVFALITVPQDGGPITANLQGPLIVKGEQHGGAGRPLGRGSGAPSTTSWRNSPEGRHPMLILPANEREDHDRRRYLHHDHRDTGRPSEDRGRGAEVR